jgi:hypothetical protein
MPPLPNTPSWRGAELKHSITNTKGMVSVKLSMNNMPLKVATYDNFSTVRHRNNNMAVVSSCEVGTTVRSRFMVPLNVGMLIDNYEKNSFSTARKVLF